MSQPKYAASLRGMKFDINANLRPRRNGKMRSKPRATAGDALRALSENDTMQQKSLQARMLRLAAQQMDSAKVEVLDFNVDNSFRSLLRRWNIHGAIAANGNKANGIKGFTNLFFENGRTHKYGKLIHLHSRELCSDKVAKLMDKYQKAKKQNGIDNKHRVPRFNN